MLNILIAQGGGGLTTVDIRESSSPIYATVRATDADLDMSGLSIKISNCLPWISGLTL
jgi:hypothetical protein